MTTKGLLAFLAFGAAASCTRSVEPSKTVRPVRVREPQAVACSAAPRFSGNVEPLARVDLAFKRGGYVGRRTPVRSNS
jgi:hypothetical protein